MEKSWLEIKSLVAKISQESTSHGLPKIISANSLSLKLFWSIFFLVSSGGCAYFIMLSLSEYLKYEAITRIKIINEKPFLFPTVTICNYNPFKNASIADRLSKNSTETLNEFGILNIAKSPEFGEENQKSLGPDIHEVITHNRFEYKDISLSQFSWYYDILHGNCFRFNSGFDLTGHKIPLYYSSRPGSLYGLQLLLYNPIDKHDHNVYNTYGMRLFIDNQTDDMSYTRGINLHPGSATDIGIKKTIIKNLPKPYSECEDLSFFSSELYDFIVRSGKMYKQKDCNNLCIQKSINEKCGCNQLLYERYKDLPACVSNNQTECSFKQIELFEETIADSCIKQCPLECKSVSFEFDISLSRFHSGNLLHDKDSEEESSEKSKNNFYDNFNEEVIADKFMFVNVYFEELKYKLIEEHESQTIVTLISNVGGTMGLFLGISLLSFIEILEIFIFIPVIIGNNIFKNTSVLKVKNAPVLKVKNTPVLKVKNFQDL